MSKKQKHSRKSLSRLFGWAVLAFCTIWSILSDAKDFWELLEWLQKVAGCLW